MFLFFTGLIVAIGATVYFFFIFLPGRNRKNNEQLKSALEKEFDALRDELNVLNIEDGDSEKLKEAFVRYRVSVLKKVSFKNKKSTEQEILEIQQLKTAIAESKEDEACAEARRIIALMAVGINPKDRITPLTGWEKFFRIFGIGKPNIHDGTWNETHWWIWAITTAIAVIYVVIFVLPKHS
jgi:hypothetical protein